MPVKSLHKVQKHITKKKGSKGSAALHENSRDAHRLQRASNREDKVFKLNAIRRKINHPYLDRMSFFHASLQFHDSPSYNLSEIQDCINTFIHRTDAELAELAASRRPGRPPSTREDGLRHKQDAELKEYRSGFWIPDLEDAENVKLFSEWNGDWAALAKYKYARVDEGGGKKDSSFPPKGLS